MLGDVKLPYNNSKWNTTEMGHNSTCLLWRGLGLGLGVAHLRWTWTLTWG